MAQDWTDTVAEALERLDVADTLEELRHHIDALIHRLAESEARNDTPVAEPAGTATPDPALDRQLDSLGKKVEFASDMLAQLTDLLESQNERIETIEQQIGDPDADPRGPAASAQETDGTQPIAELRREIALIGAERERLSERISRLEATVERLDSTIDTVRDLTFQREERVRDLEDRLFVALESRHEQPRPAEQSAAPRAMHAASERPRASIVAMPELDVPPAQHSDASIHEPMDPATARRLEDLVEREIKLQHEFSPGAQGAAERAPRPGRSTVMVVDDSADARTILSIYLSRTGYQVVTAASAEDCLAKLRHHRVDAVVLDATMPGGGGEHVLRVLSSGLVPGQKAPAIIVYTAHPEILDRDKARQLGASDYLVKGGDLLPLLTALVRHLNPSTPAAL
jgi:chemotaxis family two-component system response regulator PixH